MSTRIDHDRDVVHVPERESLPDAIRDTRRPYTHAYPAEQRMDLGRVKLFGPKKAPQPLRALVLERSEAQATEAAPVASVASIEPTELEDAPARSWADDETEDVDAAVQRFALIELD